jgi:hypothetical protein
MPITLSFDKINKIITVEAPATEATIQELHNLIMDWSDELKNLEVGKIEDTYGKQQLTGGVYVGLTMVLYDWYIAFEARPSPTWIECIISGGNLVRYDTVAMGYTSPIHPTAYVSVTISSSSSATLQELSDIQFSSFDSGVTIDVINGTSGTDYPIGTRRQPVNNLANAKTIATVRGFNLLYILGELTIGATDNIDGYRLQGEGALFSTITLTSGCSTDNTEFMHITIQGAANGEITISNECHVENLFGLNGQIHSSLLLGNLSLAGTGVLNIINCSSGVPGTGTPEIDMGGSGRGLGMRAYSGGIKIKNLSGDENISIDFISGQLKIDSTVTAGTIVVRGSGWISENNAGPNVTVDDSGLTNPDTVWDEDVSGRTSPSAGYYVVSGGTGTGSQQFKTKGEYEAWLKSQQ